ncbi:MAG: YdeI/OmpD-associated family protein [Syntrophothermus sp.]
MSKKQTFTAVIQNAGGGGAFVEVPFDVEQVLGSKKPRVRATIDGVPYRGLLTRMGGEHHMLIVLKGIREQIGKTFGDEITITVEPDTEPRVLEVPEDLMKELEKDGEARAFFDRLSYTHRKEYVTWINEAKKEETRQNRILKTIELLKKGKRGV